MNNTNFKFSNIQYQLDFEKIKTIGDVKEVLKALDLGFSKEYVDTHGLKNLVKEKGENKK